LSCKKRKDGSVTRPAISIFMLYATKYTVPLSDWNAPDGAVFPVLGWL
jgi:hypothetical protein